MNHSNVLHLVSGLLSWLFLSGTALGYQELDPSPNGQPTDEAVQHISRTTTGPGPWFEEQGKDIWARGKGFKAQFGSQGVQYYPLLGPNAPKYFPVEFGKATASIGSKAIGSQESVQAHREAQRIHYDRAGFIEIYQVSASAIEQSFVFEKTNALGDLQLNIPVLTELHAEFHEDVLSFHCEFGRVEYTAPIVLDASGRSQRAVWNWTGDSIAIRVPESFLSEAAWPVVIDPLITTFSVDDYSEELANADVAYDLTTNSFVVVYNEFTSATDRDVYFRQFDATSFALLREGYVEMTTAIWTIPRIANNNYADAFLVVATVVVPGPGNVQYRILSAVDGSLSPVRGLDSTEFVARSGPDVGGEVIDTVNSYWLVAWSEVAAGSSNSDVVCTRVGTDGISLFDGISLGSSAQAESGVSVSNTAGPGFVWNVAWSRGASGARTIRGAQVQFSGNVLNPDYLVASITGDNDESSVSSSNADGQYVVAFSNRLPGEVAIIGLEPMQGTTRLGFRWLNSLSLETEQGHPSVDSDGERFVIAWTEFINGSPGPDSFDIYVSTLNPNGPNMCESERRVHVTEPFEQWGTNPEVFCRKSGGGTSQRTHLAWEGWPTLTAGDRDIFGATYDPSSYDCLGWMDCVNPAANSTGFHSLIHGEGSYLAGGNPLTLRVTQLPPNQVGYFVTGTFNPLGFNVPGAQGLFCLGGSLGRFNRNTSEILNSGPSGSISLSVDTLTMPTSPSQAIAAGQTWYFQAWHRDLNPGQVSNFSPRLGIQFE